MVHGTMQHASQDGLHKSREHQTLQTQISLLTLFKFFYMFPKMFFFTPLTCTKHPGWEPVEQTPLMKLTGRPTLVQRWCWASGLRPTPSCLPVRAPPLRTCRRNNQKTTLISSVHLDVVWVLILLSFCCQIHLHLSFWDIFTRPSGLLQLSINFFSLISSCSAFSSVNKMLNTYTSVSQWHLQYFCVRCTHAEFSTFGRLCCGLPSGKLTGSSSRLLRRPPLPWAERRGHTGLWQAFYTRERQVVNETRV